MIPWVYIVSAFVARAAGTFYYRVERKWTHNVCCSERFSLC